MVIGSAGKASFCVIKVIEGFVGKWVANSVARAEERKECWLEDCWSYELLKMLTVMSLFIVYLNTFRLYEVFLLDYSLSKLTSGMIRPSAL